MAVVGHSQTTIDRAPRRRLRRWLAQLHLWLGLSAGLVFAVIGLSGSALVFHEQLVQWRYPELTRFEPTVDADVLARIIGREASNGLRSVQFPQSGRPTWLGFYEDGGRAYFAPDDGRRLLERRPAADPLLWLNRLHTHLLGGDAGEQVLGVVGWIALGLLVSGLYLWWPRAGRMLAQLRVYRAPPARRWLSWHRSVGVLLLPLLTLATLTGVGMVYHGAARSFLTTLFGGAGPPAPRGAEPALPDWPAVLDAAARALPDARLVRVAVPGPGDGAVELRVRQTGEWHPNGRSMVAVDARGTRVLRLYAAHDQPPGSRMADAIYPLHIGSVGGAPMRWLVVLSGLLPAFLLGTGTLFWLRRRNAPRAGTVPSAESRGPRRTLARCVSAPARSRRA